MTKPSYEELPMNRREAFLRGYEAGKRENEAELLRVRGLLQRWRTNGANSYANYFANEMEAILAQGAESADIGKLDTADESAKEIGERFADDMIANLKASAGSAETGGEKAAPADDEKLRETIWNAQTAELIRQGKAGHNVDCVDGYDLCDAILNALAYSPRSPQNQTVSSGVEGAHEGTTANEKHVCGMAGFNMMLGDTCPPCEARLAESREPEKLNNAHREGRENEN